MTVLIKSMKMPKSCAECRFNSGCDGCQGYENHCAAMEDWKDIGYDRDGYGKTVPAGVEITPTDRRMEWCPLVEVPVPHGRLIDADILAWIVKGAGELKRMVGADPSFKASNIVDAIHEATTVIEAEENNE